MSVIQHALAVVKMDAIKPVMLGAKADVGIHVKANVIHPAKMDVQMLVEIVRVVVSITVLPVIKLVRVVV